MSLRKFESFDGMGHNNQGYLLQKGWTYGGNSPRIQGSGGRFSTDAWYDGDNSAYVQTTDLTSKDTWIVGFAGKPGNDNFAHVLVLYDSTAPGYQISIVADGSRHLQARLGNYNGTVLATGTKQMTPGQYYYIEVKCVIHNSAGSLEVRIDGEVQFTLTGIDTQNTANATADRIYFGEVGGGFYGFWMFDDIYILDGDGGSPYDDYLGDCRVQFLLPSGNGNSSVLVGSDGNSTDNYLLVDDANPDDDSTYVESSTPGDKDTYAMGDLASTSGTIFGVQPLPYAKKTDAGTRTICSVVRVSGTEEDSADKTLSSTYSFRGDIRTTKPGGGAFTLSDVNAMEVGIKVTA